MNPEVARAVEELKASFPDAEVTASDTGDGGAFVAINPIDPGPAFAQRETWLKFAISFQYPHADIYPLFVRPDLARVDRDGHGKGFSTASFDDEPALQLSRVSRRLNPATDTAALKVTKVLEWLRQQ